MRFVMAALGGEISMTAACLGHGISRETGYKWLARYRASGWDGLKDQPRAPSRQAGAMSPAIAAAVLALRRQRPHWGPRKLRAVLLRAHPQEAWPAASTLGDLLRREGLVAAAGRRHRPEPVTQPFVTPSAPNDLWCIDFKGWFRTGDGRRCDPLTLSDAVSRYLLACEIIQPQAVGVATVCERLFRERGLPGGLRMDNGPPFASSGPGGLTRLSVGWVKLGIRLERITPGCPEQNGRHERMHRTLKAETSSPPAATAAAQQARFDDFRRDFNEVRPHEALGQTTPASRHTGEARAYPDRIDDPWYDANHQVRRVRTDGTIMWRGALVPISSALVGEPIGLAELEGGDWAVRFADLALGVLERASNKFRGLAAARPGRRKAEQTGETVSHVPGPKCQ
ncbi:MAG TPA: integrase core domain-containing protein [Acetobacteraceae bacterium]